MIPVRVSFWYEFIPVLTYRSVFVYMIPWKISYRYNSHRYEFIPVLTYRSVFVYKIPVKNLIPVQLVPVWDFTCKHPLSRIGLLSYPVDIYPVDSAIHRLNNWGQITIFWRRCLCRIPRGRNSSGLQHNDISFSHYPWRDFFFPWKLCDDEIYLFGAKGLSCQYFHFSSCELENKQFLIMAVSSVGNGNSRQKQVYNACKENWKREII